MIQNKIMTGLLTTSLSLGFIFGLTGCGGSSSSSTTPVQTPSYTLNSFSGTDKEFRAYCVNHDTNIVEFLVGFQDYATYGSGNNMAFVAWKSLDDNVTHNTTVYTYADGSFSLNGETISGHYIDSAPFGFLNDDLSMMLSYTQNGLNNYLCSYNW